MRLLLFLGALVGMSAVLGWYGYQDLRRWSAEPVALEEPVVVELARGEPLAVFSTSLHQHGVVDNALKFRLWARFFSEYARFQAGMYRFEGEVSPEELAEAFISGEIYVPVVLELTIPEGFTSRQIAARLAGQGVGTQEEIEQLLRDPELRRKLNVPGPSLEGFLYPATYQFSKIPSAEEVIQTMVETFWRKLPAGYEQEVKGLGLSLHEAVVFASLIELETPKDEEKPFVAEVIWRRLKDDVPLAIDAALIYGIEDYQGDITNQHLRDRDNLYNTRIHRGLPPTAVGSPALSSLKAVLQPSNEGYYYYVLNTEDGRSHHFSKTIEEHNGYVRELVRQTRRDRIMSRKQARDRRRAVRTERDEDRAKENDREPQETVSNGS